MRLLFLGTAAAEGYPGVFCNCDRCNEARALGGKNIRLRSAMLINEDLLIDFGPDLLAAAQKFGANLSCVTTGLVTHAHEDHFQPFNFAMRKDGFIGGTEIPVMRLFGPRDVEKIMLGLGADPAAYRVEPHTVQAFDHFQSGEYAITAYRAFHAVGYLEEALFYSIEQGDKAVLYATDTGVFPDDTWDALKGRSFDVIVLEETMGDGTYNQHLGFTTFFEVADRLRAEGMLRPGGRLIAHHMSHSGNPTHEKLEAFFNPQGVEVAYDGLEVLI